MSCILRVLVSTARLSAVTASLGLDIDRIWREGEKDTNRREANVNSGFNILISEANKLADQVQETLSFLRINGAKLALLKKEVESLVLDFGVSRVGKAGEFYQLPAELISAVAAIGGGVELSRYETVE